MDCGLDAGRDSVDAVKESVSMSCGVPLAYLLSFAVYIWCRPRSSSRSCSTTFSQFAGAYHYFTNSLHRRDVNLDIELVAMCDVQQKLQPARSAYQNACEPLDMSRIIPALIKNPSQHRSILFGPWHTIYIRNRHRLGSKIILAAEASQ